MIKGITRETFSHYGVNMMNGLDSHPSYPNELSIVQEILKNLNYFSNDLRILMISSEAICEDLPKL